MNGCDFCEVTQPAVWRYPARDIVIIHGEPSSTRSTSRGIPLPEGQAGSEGDWPACEECHRLLEAGDRKGLLERALEANPAMLSPVPAKFHKEALKMIHGKFFEARKGPPTRIEEEP